MYRYETAKVYARLIAEYGVNVKKGQRVILRVDIENAEFARMVASACYDAGAADVSLYYSDEAGARLRMERAELSALTDIDDWRLGMMLEPALKGACLISIVSDDPDCFAGLDAARIGAAAKAGAIKLSPFYDQLDKNENQWTVVAAPGSAWARKLFPDLEQEKAIEKLWDCIYHTMRLDEGDPYKAWDEHTSALKRRCDALNAARFKALHFKNSLGTDLTVGLPEGYIFCGGTEASTDKTVFCANMPTEEIFSMPHREQTNGVVYSSMPLIYNGQRVENFSIVFEDGKAVELKAEQGLEALKTITEIDGGDRLGEVALVPYRSMIRETGILFYNTLFDENASCHLALGSCYPSTLVGGVEMSEEERAKAGGNPSKTHVDFMFGTPDMSITGILPDGTERKVFENGCFTGDFE